MHKHHKIAKSRGGTNEDWNLVELNPYEHAYEHALDFVLFDKAPRFDFRHQAWPLLPQDLREAVIKEHSNRVSSMRYPDRVLSDSHRENISKALKGKRKTEEHVNNFRKAVLGRNPPNKGVPHTEETKRKISEALVGRTAWNKGLKKNAE